MARAASRRSSRDRVRAYRAELRRRGLRPVQIWVPDMDSPEFIAEARRQSLVIANSPHAAEDQAFINDISDFFDE
jgi:DNA-binding LacI/PurR family transcriptional regulator